MLSLCRVLRNLVDANEVINEMCFSHDGRYLACAAEECIYVNSHFSSVSWILTTAFRSGKSKENLYGILSKDDLVDKYSLDFSPNDRLFVSASESVPVQLWDTRQGIVKVFGDIVDPYFFVQFIPGGRYVATSSWTSSVRIWDVRTVRLVRNVVAISFPLAIMPDGKGMITYPVMKYWDISSLYTGCIGVRFQVVGPGECDSGAEEESSPERTIHRIRGWSFTFFHTQTIHCPSIQAKEKC